MLSVKPTLPEAKYLSPGLDSTRLTSIPNRWQRCSICNPAQRAAVIRPHTLHSTCCIIPTMKGSHWQAIRSSATRGRSADGSAMDWGWLAGRTLRILWNLFHTSCAVVLRLSPRRMNDCQSQRQSVPLPGRRYESEAGCWPSPAPSRTVWIDCLTCSSCACRNVWSAAAMLPQQPCLRLGTCHAGDPAGHEDAVCSSRYI